MRRYCDGDAVQGFGVDAVVGPFAALVTADETAVDEQLHVVRHRGLAQSEWFGEVADAGFPTVGFGVGRAPTGAWTHPARSRWCWRPTAA